MPLNGFDITVVSLAGLFGPTVNDAMVAYGRCVTSSTRNARLLLVIGKSEDFMLDPASHWDNYRV